VLIFWEIEMPLSKVIENIQRGTWELVEDNRRAHMNERYKAGDFVKTADAQDCLWLINELAGRVASITGDASDLEDAACALIKHIDDDGEDPLCAQCSGSGEGQYDGTRCMTCKGKGTVSKHD
jgi:hypothetical protein